MGKTPLFRALTRLFRNANKQGLNRREFLAGAAGVGLVAAKAQASFFLPRFPKRISATSDVVIVGAGIAGLTTAYRLRQKGIASEIYEASPRVGGRMWSQSNFNRDGMFVDLGAELVDSDNLDLITLCRELEVPIGTFPIHPEFQFEVYYSQGRVRTEAEVLAAFQPLAAILTTDIARLSVNGEFTMPSYHNPISPEVVALDHMSLREYLYSKRNEVDSFFLDILNNAYIGEYGRDTSEQSALNLLVLINPDTSEGIQYFGPSDEVMRILGGSETVPKVLAEKLKSEVPLSLNSRLVCIRDNGTQFTLYFSTSKGTFSKKASRVVLTLPFSVLREVEGIFSLGLTAAKMNSIRHLGYGTNSKLMMGFTSRFWNSVSDNVPASRGVILSDLNTQEFWDTSRLQNGASGILTSFTGGKSGEKPHDVKATLRDLAKIYPTGVKTFDGNSLLKVWSRSPFQKGSYACPMPGQFTSFIGSEGEPELNGRLLFAGEHCSSEFQGFMNGAVETGNMAAEILHGEEPEPRRRFSKRRRS